MLSKKHAMKCNNVDRTKIQINTITDITFLIWNNFQSYALSVHVVTYIYLLFMGESTNVVVRTLRGGGG